MILDLFIVLFINWRLHGIFCMIKPDRLPFCSPNTVDVFCVTSFPICLLLFFSLVLSITNGGAGSSEEWIVERILRNVRSRHITFMSKVIQQPSNVAEPLFEKKETTTSAAGQYIFLSCPEVSYWHLPSRWPGNTAILSWCYYDILLMFMCLMLRRKFMSRFTSVSSLFPQRP